MYYFCWVMLVISVCAAITSLVCLIVGIVERVRYGFGEEFEWMIRGMIAAVVGFICLKVGCMNTSCDDCGWKYDVVSPPGYCGGCGVAISEASEQLYECVCGETYDASYNFCTECGAPQQAEN